MHIPSGVSKSAIVRNINSLRVAYFRISGTNMYDWNITTAPRIDSPQLTEEIVSTLTACCESISLTLQYIFPYTISEVFT